MKLINDNQDMIKIIKEQQQQLNQIIPKIGNITNNTNNTMNNHFNLNVFLNGKKSVIPMHGTAEMGKGLEAAIKRQLGLK